MKLLVITILSFTSIASSFSQSLLEVSTLTDRIILVHFDEGDISYHKSGESVNNDVVNGEALDIEIAGNLENFSLQSLSDENYINASNPSFLYRKSKGSAFANICESWEYLPFFDLFGCKNESLDHVKEHWFYVEYNQPLQRGLSYELEVTGFQSDQASTFDFVYDENEAVSEAIHINNLGYSTNAPLKFAYVYHWMGDGGSLDLSDYANNEFKIIDVATGNTVFTGSLTFRSDQLNPETGQDNPDETPNQNFLGADVFQCDFSSLTTPGRYKIAVDGVGSSEEFEISCDSYRPAFEAVMSGIFQNRSGIQITSEYSNQPRPADHNTAETPGFAGKLKYTKTTVCEVSDADASEEDKELWESGMMGDLDAWGWYQDAGDWDGYLRHMNVPSKLFFLFDAFPENFKDGELSMPENSNNIPDILDEGRWLLRFYKRLKDETETNEWTSGGVPGARIFGDLWGGDLPDEIGRGSWQDVDRDWYVSGEDPVATYWYAGTAAHFAYILKKYQLTDVEGIDWESEARSTYSWATANYDASYFCHGHDIEHFRNYASAALFTLTSESGFENDFRDSWDKIGFVEVEFDNEKSFGGFLYTKSEFTDMDLLQEVERNIESTTEFYLLSTAVDRATRWGGNFFFPMLVGHGTGPKVFEAVIGYAWLRDTKPSEAEEYLAYLHTTADYFLGTNPLKMTWITGFDKHSPKEIFHLDDRYSDNPNIRRGIVPYGPWQRQELFFNMGPFNHNWPNKTVYPEIDKWPGHERYFGARYSPLTGEFTIEETNLNAAILYGALSGVSSCSDQASYTTDEVKVEAIDIFPNPVVEMLSLELGVDLERLDIQVFDASGSMVLETSESGKSKFTLNVGNLVNGIYFISLSSENYKAQGKFIKVR